VDGEFHLVEDLRHGPRQGSRLAFLQDRLPVRIDGGTRYDVKRPESVMSVRPE
jgi:hypothetical protein